jgi:tetratricopeptide (TPR) repeat protein
MAEQLSFINVRAAWRRALLVVPAALALWGAWVGVRWCAGATLAEYAQDLTTAEAATRLAPDNPHAHLRLARLRRVSFLPEQGAGSLAAYERAAALAPYDYLLWVELGRARSDAGETEASLAAYRRAVELAPNYAQPRWHLGNALLRAGRAEEAFAELRRAADADPALLPQVFNLAWQVFEGDMASVVGAVGRTPKAREQLIGVLVGRGRLDDAFAVWKGIFDEGARPAAQASERLARALNDQKRFRLALEVLTKAGLAEADGVTEVGQFTDGGFEQQIRPVNSRLFGWQVVPATPGVQVALDPRGAHGGARALRVLFNAPTPVEFGNVLQFVAVEPSARYRLAFFVRTEELKSASTLVVQALDTASPQPALLGASEPAPAGTSGWQESSFEFTTGPRTEAVIVRLVRPGCPEGVCPIFGKIWYDDFDLRRTDGRAAAR